MATSVFVGGPADGKRYHTGDRVYFDVGYPRPPVKFLPIEDLPSGVCEGVEHYCRYHRQHITVEGMDLDFFCPASWSVFKAIHTLIQGYPA